jgi:hypothetical protein
MPRALLSFGEMHPEGDATPLKENADSQTATDSSAFRSRPEVFSYELS